MRPAAMLAMANLRSGPPKDPVAYGELLRSSVAEVVKRQAAAGIDIVNDGEYGKSSWANYVLQRMKGYEPRSVMGKSSLVWLGRDRDRFPELVAEEFKDMPGTTTV